MTKLSEGLKEKIRRDNQSKWDKELELFKKINPFVFPKVKYDNSIITLTYAEFKQIIKELK